MFRILCGIGAVWAIVWLGLLGASGRADDRAGYQSILFNGHDLDGWQAATCQAGVEDGLLVLQAGDGWLRTNERHGDFVLELDWRARKQNNYDSGIYIRAAAAARGQTFPQPLPGQPEAGGRGQSVATRRRQEQRAGEAGRVESLQNHRRRRHGRVGNQRQACLESFRSGRAEGYIGLQSEVDLGGQFEFRNIELTDLDYRPLFNGRDLAGWTGDTAGYAVEDGAIVSPAARRPAVHGRRVRRLLVPL